MPAPPDASEPGAPDPWDNDPWKRDRWKEADWGKPAAPPSEVPPQARRGGLASWSAGMIEAGPYLTLGAQSALGMAFFVGLGYGVDRWLGSRPWGLIAGAVLGMVGVFALLVRVANRANAASRRQRGDAETPERRA